MFAAKSGNLEVVKYLIDKGADVNSKPMNGFTALKMAQMRGHEEMVELLKAHGAKE